MKSYFSTVGYRSIGKQGRPNEDRYRILGCDRVLPDDRPGPYLDSSSDLVVGVFDGVGSAPKGMEAAQLAANSLDELFTMEGQLDETIFERTLRDSSETIAGWGCIEATDRPVGATTATVGWVSPGGTLTIRHVGDSAVYLCRNDSVEQLTRDHSNDSGLFAYLGQSGNSPLHARSIELVCEDVLLFVTDGVTKGVSRHELITIVERYLGEPNLIADELCEMAARRGVQDDITAVVIDLDLP